MTKCFEKRFDELSAAELYEILKLRSEVFVVEQNCVYQDLDDKDKGAIHVWLEEDGVVVACARVLDVGVSYEGSLSIGRVVSKYRAKNLGLTVMNAAISAAKRAYGNLPITISAQQYAVGFYQKFGFKVISTPYLEDNIPHVKMLLSPTDSIMSPTG